MPFLTLNGITIPTKAGGEIKITEYGERTAAFDGSAQIDVRARKREWQFTTKPISMIRSRALEGLVQGLGLYMPYDFTTGGAGTGIYAANGLYPTTISSNYGYNGYVGADGVQNLDENGVQLVHSGTQSLSSDTASTNLATAALASCSSTTGWTSTNITLGVSTTRYWEGANSILCTPTSTPSSVSSATVTTTASTKYVVSFYMYSLSAVTFKFGTTTGSGNTLWNTAAVHPGGCWKRFYCVALTPSGSTATGVYIIPPGTAPFYIDGIQIEALTTNNYPTTFSAGGVTRAAFDSVYPFNYYNPTGFTVSAWVTGNLSSTTLTNSLFSLFDTNGNRITNADFSGVPVSTLSFVVNTNAGTYTQNPTFPSGFTFNTQWNHIVCTYTGAPFTNSAGTTFPNAMMYLNGALLSSGTVQGAINTPVNAEIGAAYGSSQLQGRLDDVQVLPFGVDQPWVAQTYAAAAPLGTVGPIGLTPFLTAAGDGIDGAPVTVHGSVKQATYIGYQDVRYGWISQGRQLQILLVEA